MDLACFVSCSSAAFSSRLTSVLRCMSVRTSSSCRVPLFLFGPLCTLFGCFWGVRFALRQDSLQFVAARALENGAQFTLAVHCLVSSSCLSPFVFLASRSCPVRPPCFRYPTGPASVPLKPCAAPRLLLPLVFCRQAYGPCPSSSFRLAPFALASPAPAQHEFPHCSWLGSVLAWSPCQLPDRHGFRPGWLPFKR